ncbi:MAG: hypothetical protein J7M24_05115 [Candidatus Latescibacteria bacterium]|nr:hypothetical protein [Candidatus Latescibacterota bacterium]
MSKIVDEFLAMLSGSEEMLSYAFDSLKKKGRAKKAQKRIYNRDQDINLMERDLRSRILDHLSTSPRCNIPACLVLISIAKDAERVGDYIKNLIELPRLLKDSKRDKEIFRILFDEIGSELLILFRMSSDSIRKSDSMLASKTVSKGHDIAERCEGIIEDVATSEYDIRQAVVLALGARYMKRIALHLSNIATSVVNPFPEMDFKTFSE